MPQITTRPSRLLPLTLISLVMMLTGCQSTATDSLDGPYQPVTHASASTLWPIRASSGRAVMDDGGTIHDTIEDTKATTDGLWRMRVMGFWIVDAEVRDDASVWAHREIDLSDNRRVEYDPPLPLLPDKLTQGETLTHTSDVRVFLHSTNSLETTGKCTATYTLLGAKHLGSATDQPAVIVQTDRAYDMPLVTISLRLRHAYQPGEGPVVGQALRVVKLLGLLPVVREQTVTREPRP